MKDIKRLPRNVCNSLRSSVVLFDLPRVVEELIFNSVEAHATKVFIHVNVGAYYIKVEDDGYGITRDGLVLLGENLATSKIHLLPDMEAYSGSLVCRGEALSSLSDVSLVEVLSKARGKPNSYCKIIKGRKCIFLGISDKRDVVGTTVIVRDLFYNQPVRRKYIQSRPKKVLHSVKKCVLRIALVNPEILFRVVDLESETELLRTLPSSSPLHLISNVFGDEVSGSLQEITFSDKEIKVSGYISGPRDAFSTKAFQYVYINSRFVCKGPIHNLLNTMASSLQSSTEIKFHNGKRPRTQTYPPYILNIICPISMYDLTFEPSKTILEFKDWAVVLSFLKQVIWQFWEKLLQQQSQGKAFSSNDAVPIENEIQIASKSCTIRKKKEVVWSPQSSLHYTTSKTSVDFKNHRLAGTVKRLLPELKPCRSNSGDVCQTNCSDQGQIADKEASFSFKHDQMGRAKICRGMSTSSFDSVIRKDPIVSFEILKENSDTDCLGLRWGDNSCGGGRSLVDESTQILCNCDPSYCVKNNTEEAFRLVGSVGLNEPDLKANQGIEFEPLNAASYTCSPVEFESGHSKHLPLYDFTHSPGVDYDCKTSKLELMWRQQLDDSVLENCQSTRESDVFLGDSVNPFSPVYSSFTKESNFSNDLTTQLWENGSDYVSRERYIDSPYCASGRSLFDDSTCIYNFDAKSLTLKNDFGMTEGVERSFKYMSDNSHGALYATSFKGSKFNCIDCFSPHIKSLCYGQLSDDICFGGKVNDEQDRWFLDHSEADFSDNHRRHAFYGHMDVADSILKHKENKPETQDSRLSHGCPNIRSKRSQSAPPFYKGKCKFSIINTSHQTTVEWKEYLGSKFKPGTICSLDELAQLSHVSQPLHEASLVEISPCSRESSGKVPVADSTDEALGNKQPQRADNNNNATSDAIEGFGTDGLEYASRNLTKWRNHDSQPTGGDMRHGNNDDILDISSGLLHLTGSSLVPDSISRECLQNARVLLQVDKKFIPVMAGDTLIMIDQHAADERIRLEELRRKVLSGEGNTISYLDEEQDLILPEIGFQILHNYADQIQKWGWICNIHTECSESFSKNMNLMNRRPHAVTLLAVPCILGINLTDKDLLEYLEQLAETDGSSTLPPAVTRILNFKACRGAIMFGDSLLPSESSLIIEELKATSLCFQCAHGRPTTAPLLNMVSLHEQLTMLEMRLHAPENTWHGLSQHRPSIERAQQRLASAKRFQKG